MSKESVSLDSVIQERIHILVAQGFHFKRLGAMVRFQRTKNELKALVDKYGKDIMTPTFEVYGYTPNPRKYDVRNLVMNKEIGRNV